MLPLSPELSTILNPLQDSQGPGSSRARGSPASRSPLSEWSSSAARVRAWSSEPFHTHRFPGFRETVSEAANVLGGEESRSVQRRACSRHGPKKPPAHLRRRCGPEPQPAAHRRQGQVRAAAARPCDRPEARGHHLPPHLPASSSQAAEQLSFLRCQRPSPRPTAAWAAPPAGAQILCLAERPHSPTPLAPPSGHHSSGHARQ